MERPPFLDLLRCPRTRAPLRWEDGELRAEDGSTYGVAGGTLLLHPDHPHPEPRELPGALHRMVVEQCYAGHNRSRTVREALADVLGRLGEDTWGLNVGGGFDRLHKRLITLDLEPRDEVDISGDAHRLPFADGSLAVVVSQEVLEHLADPVVAMAEIARVLKPKGLLYLQVPFVIGYHPGPTDLWRFSREGLVRIVEQAGLVVDRCDIAVGAGTGMYRIAVEFAAVVGGLVPIPKTYLAAKGAAAVLLHPLTWLDPLLDHSPGRDRIPGGYFVVARRP